MIKWFVEYSVGETSTVQGVSFLALPDTRISVDGWQEIITCIAEKEGCEETEVFIDNIAKISSN